MSRSRRIRTEFTFQVAIFTKPKVTATPAGSQRTDGAPRKPSALPGVPVAPALNGGICMKSRIAIVTAALLACSAAAAIAQAPQPAGPPQGQGAPGPGAAGRMQALLQGITLTAQQQAKVDSINTAYQGQMPAMTPGPPPDSAAMPRRREMGQKRKP